jgi:CO dehydrogenase maturation factor
MPKVIAMAGKGGTGKTTISALLIHYLLHRGLTPVLAVDADANANLNELLGLTVDLTLGEIRKALKQEMPPHITRDQYMEMQVHQALVEARGFDLLVMGQPDGPGCYCAANQYLAMTMDHLASNYHTILVDNEAGMEHLSRMNLRTIDHLLVISDPSARGILTARRIAALTGPLAIDTRNQWLIVNRVPEPAPAELTDKIQATVEEAGLPLAGILPASDELVQVELSGRSFLELEAGMEVLDRAYTIFDTIFAFAPAA